MYERTVSDPAGDSPLAVHADWIKELVARHGMTLEREQADALLKEEVGRKFAEILGHAGVFKVDEAGREAFRRFVGAAGYQELSS
ncbi:galactose-1-phosphate uridylyltransferase [compost metagenome]